MPLDRVLSLPVPWLSKFRLRRRLLPDLPLKSGQTERARRYALRLPVRYRCGGEQEWHESSTENISCTGLLFHTTQALVPKTPVEISFPLPGEIAGRTEVRVAGSGYVVRSIVPGHNGPLAAAAVVRYRLLYGEKRPENGFARAMQRDSALEFASTIGREFNDQLAIIIGNSEILLSQPNLPEAVRRGIEQSKAAALRAATLVEQVSAYPLT